MLLQQSDNSQGQLGGEVEALAVRVSSLEAKVPDQAVGTGNAVNFEQVNAPHVNGGGSYLDGGGVHFPDGSVQASAYNPNDGAGKVGGTWVAFGNNERGASGNYYNDTGKTIQVFATYGCNGGGSGSFYVNDQRLGFWQAQFNGCGGYSLNPGGLVPPGCWYRVENMGGGFISWWELR
jgi:hypothetical protein